MGKYEPLGEFLRAQSRAKIPMTFTEIERLLGTKLPKSKMNRAWWSNNPDNNVMTRQWLGAGFETAAVDVQAGKLEFRRQAGAQPLHRQDGLPAREPGDEMIIPSERYKASIFGCMKGLFTLEDGFDPASPVELEPDWDRKYRP